MLLTEDNAVNQKLALKLLERMGYRAEPHIIAKAMQGDREMCLQAGMNDYVSKPIQVKELQKAIENIRKQGNFAVVTPKDLTTEHTESTEKTSKKSPCAKRP